MKGTSTPSFQRPVRSANHFEARYGAFLALGTEAIAIAAIPKGVEVRLEDPVALGAGEMLVQAERHGHVEATALCSSGSSSALASANSASSPFAANSSRALASAFGE